MKIHKENVKRYFKDKNTITALVLLFCFLCVFIVSLTHFATSIKGVVELFSHKKIEQVYTNNYSVIYAVDEDNTLYYSYNKLSMGHLNAYEGIEPLENEYGDATSHYYNFISISYKFNHDIVKVDGFRDGTLAIDGYTLVLTDHQELYVLYAAIQQGSPWLKIADNIIDFDVGYQNFTVINNEHRVYEYIHKDAFFYQIEIGQENIIKVATQGHQRKDQSYIYSSYYVNNEQQIIKNQIEIDYDKIQTLPYEETQVAAVRKITLDLEQVQTQKVNCPATTIKQILAIENATFVLDDKQKIYAIGNNYINDDFVEEDVGIFGNDVRQYDEFTPIAQDINHVVKITTGGPFCLIIKTTHGFYYSGNIGFEHTTQFKKITNYGTFDEIFPGLYSTIVLKKGIVYYINYENHNSLIRMYENYFVKYIVRYVSLFLVIMTLFYLVVYFKEENDRYNRYFKRRYEENESQKNH